IEVVLLPLDHGAILHRGWLDGHDRGEWLFGEDEAANVNRAVPRNLMESVDDLGERTNAFVLRIKPRMHERRAAISFRRRDGRRRIPALVMRLLRVRIDVVG